MSVHTNLIRSTSLKSIASLVRSYNFVVLGELWAAIRWACSTVPPFSKNCVMPVARNLWQDAPRRARRPAGKQPRLVRSRTIYAKYFLAERSLVLRRGSSVAWPKIARSAEGRNEGKDMNFTKRDWWRVAICTLAGIAFMAAVISTSARGWEGGIQNVVGLLMGAAGGALGGVLANAVLKRMGRK